MPYPHVTPVYEAIAARISSNLVAIPRIPIDKTLSLYRCSFCNIVPCDAFKQTSTRQIACETCAPLHWSVREPDVDAQRYLDRLVPCPNGCSLLIRNRKCKYHLMYECQWTEVLCTVCLTVRRRDALEEECNCETNDGRDANFLSKVVEIGNVCRSEYVEQLQIKNVSDFSAVSKHDADVNFRKRFRGNSGEDRQKVRQRVSDELARDRSHTVTDKPDNIQPKAKKTPPATRSKMLAEQSAIDLAEPVLPDTSQSNAPSISKKERKRREQERKNMIANEVPHVLPGTGANTVWQRPEKIPKRASRYPLKATFKFTLASRPGAPPLRFSFYADPLLLRSAHFVIHGNRAMMLEYIFSEFYLRNVEELSIFCAPGTDNMLTQGDLHLLRDLILNRPIKSLDMRGFCVESNNANEIARNLIKELSLMDKRLGFFNAVPIDIPPYVSGSMESGTVIFEYRSPQCAKMKFFCSKMKNWEISNVTEVVLNIRDLVGRFPELLVALLKRGIRTMLIKYEGKQKTGIYWNEARAKSFLNAVKESGKVCHITLDGFDSVAVELMQQFVGGLGIEGNLHYLNTRRFPTKEEKRMDRE